MRRGVKIILDLVLVITSLVVVLMPVWLFLLVKRSLNPEGFGEAFAFWVIGIFLGGGLQLFLSSVWKFTWFQYGNIRNIK
jgi:hypothetical protein